jgi:hypothetical protein
MSRYSNTNYQLLRKSIFYTERINMVFREIKRRNKKNGMRFISVIHHNLMQSAANFYHAPEHVFMQTFVANRIDRLSKNNLKNCFILLFKQLFYRTFPIEK